MTTSGETVAWTPARVPGRVVLAGASVRLEPPDPAAHAEALFRRHMAVKGRCRGAARRATVASGWPLARAAFEQRLSPYDCDARMTGRR